MAWAGVLFFFLLITPVRLGAIVHWDQGLPGGAAGIMVWGLRTQVNVRAVRGPEGKLALAADRGGRDIALPRPRQRAGFTLKALYLMLKSNGNRAALRKMVRVRALEATVRLGGGDAAALALLTGFFRGLNGALPFLRLQCVPVLGGPFGLHVRCIAEARLGMLLAAALLWRKSSRQAGQKEEKAWTIPSET